MADLAVCASVTAHAVCMGVSVTWWALCILHGCVTDLGGSAYVAVTQKVPQMPCRAL